MRRQRGLSASKNGGPQTQNTVALIREFETSRPVRPSPLTASSLQDIPLDLLDRIRSFPLFFTAPDSFLAAVGTHLKPQIHAPRENILTEGDEAKAMYWLVRGAVTVTSRDRESIFAELKPGSFFGEIGILLDIPRTANVVATHKTLVLRLNKEDLRKILPRYPEIEQAIRHEAAERLAILDRKKLERQHASKLSRRNSSVTGKRTRDDTDKDRDLIAVVDGPIDSREGEGAQKKRKSPSPALVDTAATSVLSSGTFHIRNLLTELPLFRSLPADVLHFLGMNAQPRNYPPFTNIIDQGSVGREVFFITEGTVEVFKHSKGPNANNTQHMGLKARLGSGQYFGEIYSLSLAPRRTATVRSVTGVECLIISGEVLDELWRRCSSSVREQVEATAKERLKSIDEDVKMLDRGSGALGIDNLAIVDAGPTGPLGSFSRPESGKTRDLNHQSKSIHEPFDPDPYGDAEKAYRGRASRRGSLANIPPETSPLAEGLRRADSRLIPSSPGGSSRQSSRTTSPRPSLLRPKVLRRQPSQMGKGIMPDKILIQIFQNLDVISLIRFRQASMHWSKLISSSKDILKELDLSAHGRIVTDNILIDHICPFVGDRPLLVNINNCHHVTDEGFIALVQQCGMNVTTWKMKSVWDISAQAVVSLADTARRLEEVDFSNCRKVSDNLLGRVVGWVTVKSSPNPFGNSKTPAGLVVGCPNLSRLTLSYCKHVSDRSMAHLAAHANTRLETINLTRCTSITDQGFAQWAERPFPRLKDVVLADCTYLSDNAILCLARAAPRLERLDLSFCCALSDTAVEHLSRGCRGLTHLSLAFCGSAVSDNSLQGIANNLKSLRDLSVRGCVRVTGTGVEAILSGCPDLERLDVSQCKNLAPWLDAHQYDQRLHHLELIAVADGKWRVSTD